MLKFREKLSNKTLVLLMVLSMVLAILPISVFAADEYGPQGDRADENGNENYQVCMTSPSADRISVERLENGDYYNTISGKFDPDAVSFQFDAGNSGGTMGLTPEALGVNKIRLYSDASLSDDSLIAGFDASVSDATISIVKVGAKTSNMARGVKFQLDIRPGTLDLDSTYYLVFDKSLGLRTATLVNDVIFEFATIGDPTLVDTVTLNHSTILFDGLNQTDVLSNTIEPTTALNRNVVYTSSDPSVVSVDNGGRLKALKAGRSIVTITTEDGNKTDTCEVIVKDSENNRIMYDAKGTQYASSGAKYQIISPNVVKDPNADNYVITDKMFLDDLTNLRMVALPDGGQRATRFSFSIYSDPELTDLVEEDSGYNADADSGAGTGAAGDSTISEQVVGKLHFKGLQDVSYDFDEDLYEVGKTYYFVINATTSAGSLQFGQPIVVEFTVDKKAESISLDKTTAEVEVGEELTLTPTVLPENHTETLIWTSSDESIATVENGVVKTLKPGNVTITVTTSDTGLTASCELTVNPKKVINDETTLAKTDNTEEKIADTNDATTIAPVFGSVVVSVAGAYFVVKKRRSL